MRWAYERTFLVIKTQLKRRKDWQQELTTAESLMRSGILDGYLSHHHDHQLMLLLDENLERKIDWGPPISEATLTEAANDTRCQYEKSEGLKKGFIYHPSSTPFMTDWDHK